MFLWIFLQKRNLLPEKSFLGEFYTKLRVRGRPERNFYFFSKTHTSRLQSRTEPKFEKFTLCWRRPIIERFLSIFQKFSNAEIVQVFNFTNDELKLLKVKKVRKRFLNSKECQNIYKMGIPDIETLGSFVAKHDPIRDYSLRLCINIHI